MSDIVSSTRISDVWAGHAVRFDFMVRDGRQYAAFYDGDRRMTVAACDADGSGPWSLNRLKGVKRKPFFDSYGPEQELLTTVLPWDGHNHVTLGIDPLGYIHVSGNMHNDPLVYFRSRRPHDSSEFERLDRMTGENEGACTYPHFIEGPRGEFVFRYREGRSGNGADFYNIYDPENRVWRRLQDRPLLDGLGRMNAYSSLPTRGPDGRYHMVWVWRDTGDCATNHDVSYMCSSDLIRWTTADGRALELPVVLESGAVVDPVPVRGGVLNDRQWLGFDARQRPVISYTKFDEKGNTQAYCARFEDGRWVIRRISDWDYRWEFSGNGCIPNGEEILLGPVSADGDGSLCLPFHHIHAGDGAWRLDPEGLEVVETFVPRADWPKRLERATSDFPGMLTRILPARGDAASGRDRFILRWESLGANRDKSRNEWPPPSELRWYRLAADGKED